MLTNPRLQNLSSKMVSALNQNKIALAQQQLSKIISYIGEKNPKVASDMRKIDLSQLQEIKDQK